MPKFSFKFSKLFYFSLVLALIFILLPFFFISLQKPSPLHPHTPTPTFVSFKSSFFKEDKITAEQFLIFDPLPIFLPSIWNQKYASAAYTNDLPLFQDFSPEITLLSITPIYFLQNISSLPVSTRDTLSNQFINPFAGIGQLPYPTNALPKRIAHLSLTCLSNSNFCQNVDIHEELDPSLTNELWSPAQWIILIDETGPVLPIQLIKSSNSEKVDTLLKNYLSTPLRLSQLPPGYYELTISP